jgi:hypothetical protein
MFPDNGSHIGDSRKFGPQSLNDVIGDYTLFSHIRRRRKKYSDFFPSDSILPTVYNQRYNLCGYLVAEQGALLFA